ncbi:FadD3 family acyl-CoA ligase [Litorivivens sp.]|uniref:FadD3 family acyl-CoA ligase n=1 Tax=Litorivivens sp. TaxID=2020868 RepID=UPI0035647238
MSDTKLPLSLPALIAWAANEYKDQVAIKEETRRVSYAELAGLAQRSAAAFLAAGVNKGDRVAIWAPNMTEWIEAAIGLLSAGAVLVPLNNRLQGAEAADILRRSGARILLTYTRLEKGEPLALLESESLPELEKRILLRGEDARAQTWDDFLAGGDNLNRDTVSERAASVAPDDIADMLFTSGTTGKPKGVLCTHRQNIQVFKTWGDTVGLRSSDNYLIINPFFHTFGYKAGWLASIIFGSTTLPVMAFDKEAAMAQIESDQVTMLPGAPSLYEMLLADPARDNYDLSSLRLGVTGAAAVPVQLVKDMRSVLGFKTVVTAYGLTESTGVVSICRPDDDAETIATTSGRAIEGVEVKCANPDTGAEVPRGSEGEIWVRGYNVMQGYFDMPEATAETITSDGWLRTGDIGVMDERGYLRITDRLKDMYIMNGENVYPAEVEKALYGLEGVAQVAVIGVPKQPQGEVGMAFIVPKPGSDPDKDAVIEHASRHLARYKVPMYVEIVDSLPLNASGKVVKPELKAKAKAILGNG